MSASELALIIDKEMRRHSESNMLRLRALARCLFVSACASKRPEKSWAELRGHFHTMLDQDFDQVISTIESGRQQA